MMKYRIAAGVLVGAAWFSLAQIDEIAGFRVPEYDENGNLKSQIYGDFAKIRDNDQIEITNLKIEMYRDGAIDILVTAPHCIYDQKSNRAHSESRVRIARDNTVITGEHFSWDMKEQHFVILKNAKVVLKNLRNRMDEGEL